MFKFIYSLFRPLAYISLPVFLLRSVSTSSLSTSFPMPFYFVRRGLYLGCMTAIATWGILVAASMSLVGRQYDVNWVIARAFYALAGSVLDIRVEIEGDESHLTKEGAKVILCNHQSMLDILFVGRMMPKRTSMLSKKSLQYTPLGPFMLMSGAVFIDRSNNTSAIRSLEAAGELMKERKVSLWMYPEGTRHLSEKPELLPFKKGAFHLAVKSGIPIVPIVTENYWRMYRSGYFGNGVVRIKVLPPVSTENLTTTDVPEVMNRVRDQMVDALRDISVKVASQPVPQDSASPSTATSISKPDDLESTETETQAAIVPVLSTSTPSSLSQSAPKKGEGSTSMTSTTLTTSVPVPLPSSIHAPAPVSSSVPAYSHELEPESGSDLRREAEQPITRTRTSSTASSLGFRSDSSENGNGTGTGTETEEDEGMVLVGRPT